MKKQMLMGRQTPHLPEEIVQEILKRLPVRSLIRFQCVCKHWKNLIKSPSPSFIAENLRHQNPSLLLWNQNTASDSLHLSLMDCEMRVRELQNPPLLGSLSEAWIVGSCNGLVCVGINEDDISDFLLWNPATGEVRQIHKTRSRKLTEWDPTGFGFNATVIDYKIVQSYDDPNKAMISTIEAYSLSTGSWKEVEFGSLEAVKPYGDSFTANGCIFWVGLKSEEEEEVENHSSLIVSFDIAKEVFTLIPGPPRLHNSRCGFTLSVQDDKLAMLSHSKIGHFPKYLYSLIDLWVLEEGIGSYTKRWSWSKKYTCPSMFHFPLTIWRNDIVWGSFANKSGDERENDKEIDCQFFIDVITNEGKMFATHGDYVNVFNHVDSLIPIGNSHKHSL